MFVTAILYYSVTLLDHLALTAVWKVWDFSIRHFDWLRPKLQSVPNNPESGLVVRRIIWKISSAQTSFPSRSFWHAVRAFSPISLGLSNYGYQSRTNFVEIWIFSDFSGIWIKYKSGMFNLGLLNFLNLVIIIFWPN